MFVQALSVSPFSHASSARILQEVRVSTAVKTAKEEKEVDVFFRKAPLGFRMAHKQAPLKVNFLCSIVQPFSAENRAGFDICFPVGLVGLVGRFLSKMFPDLYHVFFQRCFQFPDLYPRPRKDHNFPLYLVCIWYYLVVICFHCRWPTSTTKAA